MTWISLVCLLALSSAAFGRSVSFDGGYGGSTRVFKSGYGQELPPQEVRIAPIQSGYGSSFVQPITRTLPVSNYGGYGGSFNRVLGGGDLIVETMPPTQADILCRGQAPQTVIPIERNTKFVICLEDGKGTEQSCPLGLLYHTETRRCERKLGPMEDFCISQPCLNGAQCLSGDSTFQCQCAPGWDGTICELDARMCQTNRPCGSDSRVRCQSFRPGAALEWICVSDEDLTYGPDGSHVHRSPCEQATGPHALAYTDKGFIMCNGILTHYESCPRNTKWDNLNKACVWPDMEEIETRFIGKSGYGSTFVPTETRVLSSYDKEIIVPSQPKVFSSYGGETRRLSSYGGDVVLPAPMPETRTFSSYGGETKRLSSYGGDVVLPAPMPETRTFSSYGGEIVAPAPITKTFSSYGGEIVAPAPITKTFSSYGGDVVVPETRTFSSYGGSRLLAPQTRVKVASSYGGY